MPENKHYYFYRVFCIALIASGCAPDQQSSLHVRNACNTFVSEFSPRKTPELRSRSEGLELVLSLTPAKNPEAQAIISSARKGTVELIIHPGMERLQVIGEEDSRLVISVPSEARAKQVKKLLCFEHENSRNG